MTDKTKGAPKIDRNEAFNRDYIPLPGGWEVQTKGHGSTFRIAHGGRDDRWPVLDEHLHPILEEIARTYVAERDLLQYERDRFKADAERLNHNVIKVRDERDSLRAANAWLPIALAPRNGKKIVGGYWNKLGKWRTVIAFYAVADFDFTDDDGEPLPEGWYESSQTQDTVYLTEEPLVMFQRLPAPPHPTDAVPAELAICGTGCDDVPTDGGSRG